MPDTWLEGAMEHFSARVGLAAPGSVFLCLCDDLGVRSEAVEQIGRRVENPIALNVDDTPRRRRGRTRTRW